MMMMDMTESDMHSVARGKEKDREFFSLTCIAGRAKVA